jgi:hypothetical protein
VHCVRLCSTGTLHVCEQPAGLPYEGWNYSSVTINPCQTYETPSILEFALVLLFEALHTIGTGVLFFVAFPGYNASPCIPPVTQAWTVSGL